MANISLKMAILRTNFVTVGVTLFKAQLSQEKHFVTKMTKKGTKETAGGVKKEH